MRRAFGLCLACGLCSFALVLSPSASEGVAAPPDSKPNSPIRYIGSIGCAAAACHNAGESLGRPGNEYATWMRDPHARAYTVLLNPQSQSISRNLQRDKPAYQDTQCLACHATPTPADDPGAVVSGVGCESCHGPAKEWRALHYQPHWKTLSPAEKAQYGMADTKDLVSRAQSCVACHVGTPEKDVNHDLIAAGHPRVAFEFAGYLGSYTPKHWLREQEPFGPEFEVRAWEVGQLISARAAADLLQARADKAPAWPEFAEYGCFNCHHDLNTQRASDTSGTLTWGSWYFALPDSDELPHEDVTRLAKLMARSYPPRSDVALAAAKLRDSLNTALRTSPTQSRRSPDAVYSRLMSLIHGGENIENVQNWEAATQRYLAIAAHAQCLGDSFPPSRTPERRAALVALRNELSFPAKPGRSFDSPPSFSPRRIVELLRLVDDQFAPKR